MNDQRIVGRSGAYDSTHGLVMSGGANLTKYLANETCMVSSVETTLDGISFSNFTPMPLDIMGHCLVALDNGGDIFMTGGQSNFGASNMAYIYRGRAGGSSSWERQPNMPTAKYCKLNQ